MKHLIERRGKMKERIGVTATAVNSVCMNRSSMHGAMQTAYRM